MAEAAEDYGDFIRRAAKAVREARPGMEGLVRDAAIARGAAKYNYSRDHVAQELDAEIDAQKPIGDVTKEHVSKLLERELERMQNPQHGIATPFRLLNYLIVGGFQAGELIYLGARPAVGKSAMALDFAREAAKRGKRVLVVSREMHGLAIARRLLAQEGKLNASRLRTGSEDMADVAAVALRLSALPIWITDSAASLADIEAMAESIDFLIVDYLQLVRAPDAIKERRLQVEHTSSGLKALALKLAIPVLCLSSLARPREGNPEPTLASFRESGEIEHDADVALLLHRMNPNEPEVTCIVAKNRDGETGRVKLRFVAEWVSFHQVDESYVEL